MIIDASENKTTYRKKLMVSIEVTSKKELDWFDRDLVQRAIAAHADTCLLGICVFDLPSSEPQTPCSNGHDFHLEHARKEYGTVICVTLMLVCRRCGEVKVIS